MNSSAAHRPRHCDVSDPGLTRAAEVRDIHPGWTGRAARHSQRQLRRHETVALSNAALAPWEEARCSGRRPGTVMIQRHGRLAPRKSAILTQGGSEGPLGTRSASSFGMRPSTSETRPLVPCEGPPVPTSETRSLAPWEEARQIRPRAPGSVGSSAPALVASPGPAWQDTQLTGARS